jgi:hypothetical protein
VEATEVPAITIVMTAGANLRRVRATAMMMHGRLDAVLATIDKNQIKTGGIATAILAGPTEIATIETAIARSPVHSADMFTCSHRGLGDHDWRPLGMHQRSRASGTPG